MRRFALDRGPDPIKCLRFVNDLPNKILIKGNHESLLQDCIARKEIWRHDIHNGTANTVCELGCYGPITNIDQVFDVAKNNPEWVKYQKSLIDYYETDKYIFVHSWIPYTVNHKTSGETYYYKKDWRTSSKKKWEEAKWPNPYEMALQGLNKTNKVIVFGHFHTSYMHHICESTPEFGEGANFEPFYGDGFIGIDACTAYSHKVNVVVLEV